MRILEIKILSDDLIGTESFYAGILGLKVLLKNKNSISFKAGFSKLSFLKSEDIQPRYHFAFNIPNNKLPQAIKWAHSRVSLIPIEGSEVVADFKKWNAKSIYFYDNNENILEFIARFDLNNTISTDFDIHSIQNISEIGLISDSPEKLAEELIQKYDLFYFEKGAQADRFKTLGSDEGLIIIVQSNHHWYPTNQKAQKFSVAIDLEVNGKIRYFRIENKNTIASE